MVPEGFPELESLTIRNAWLQSISVGFLPKLRRIDLGQNQLTNAELAGVRHSLEHVDLSANRLNDVNFLQGFSQLKTLDMYSHNLTTLTLPWGLVSLRELGLWHETASLDAPEDNPSLRIKFKPVRPIPSPYVYLGVPASTDLEHLVIYGIPKSRASVLGFFMPSPIRRADGSVALRIRGANGRSVQVQRSSNLMDWESWQTVMLGENGAELSWDQPVALQFFRVSENGTD